MSFFGLTDPWIVGAYVGCFLCVIFCVAYGLKKGGSSSEEDDDNGQ